MFIGHYGVGFALKRIEPRLSLGTLILGTVLLDILFGIFLLTNLEHARIVPGATVVSPFEFYDYPISHSATGAIIWSALGFLVYLLWPSGDRHSRMRPALTFAAAIFSHFVLDVISHSPDMPLLTNDSVRIGFSLWNSLPATIIVEFSLFLAGVIMYIRSTRSSSWVGKFGPAFMAVLLGIFYLGGIFGPPPPDMEAVAFTITIGQLILTAIAYWIDGQMSNKLVDNKYA